MLFGKYLTMSTINFYHDLPNVSEMEAVFASDNHMSAPADWLVAITDVIDSTKAIESGRYKDVNTAGGLAAMAIANVTGDMDFPFIFGGDGIVSLIPPDFRDQVHDVLIDTSSKVKAFFDLDLRVGLIPVADLYEKGYKIEVAKLKVSPYYNQAIIRGNGLFAADSWIKYDSSDNPYRITEKNKSEVEADFTGFTCRWQDIPSARGETIATIVQLRDEKIAATLFPKILMKLEEIFGKKTQYHPIQAEHLHLSQKPVDIDTEAKVLARPNSKWSYWSRMLQVRFETFVTNLAMRFKLPVKAGWYELKELKQYQVVSSDYQKFDGSFKIVLIGSSQARQQWVDFLESCYEAGEVFYGIHVADRALMTCLLHANSTREVHFIDAADGGYALAAKQLKQQILRS